jgi:hypothetical protein
VPLAAPKVDSTPVKAIARAFRRRKMLETGRYSTIQEIAKAEKINLSYVSRVLRLTLLVPTLVESIVAGSAQHPPSLDDLMRPSPALWPRQAETFARMSCLRKARAPKDCGSCTEGAYQGGAL